MQNFEACKYTYLHRKAFLYTVNKIIKDEVLKEQLIKRAKAHDMDKMMSYLTMSKEDASRIHRRTAKHHMENNLLKTHIDYVEAVIDYECAGYTKPDKPLNAYDTINHYHPKDSIYLLTVCKVLGIDRSYSNVDDEDAKEYMKQFENVTEEDIYNEIKEYQRFVIESAFEADDEY